MPDELGDVAASLGLQLRGPACTSCKPTSTVNGSLTGDRGGG